MTFLDCLAPVREPRPIGRGEKIIRLIVFVPILLAVGWPIVLGGAALILAMIFPPIMFGVVIAFLPKLTAAIADPADHILTVIIAFFAILALIGSSIATRRIRQDYLPFGGRMVSPVRLIAAQQVQIHD